MPLFGGPPSIKKLEAKRDVNGLIKALEYHKDMGRTASDAAEALGRIGDPRAVEPLLGAIQLQVTHMSIRMAGARALGLLGDVRAVEPLITLLASPTRSVSPVVEALGRLGDARAVGPLLKLLREYAVSAGNRKAEQREATDAIVQIGPPAIPVLVAALANHKENRPLREAAATVLGQMGDPRAVEPLIAALMDQAVSRAVVKALDDLAWRPDRGTPGAAYWAAKGQWDECVEIGAPAVRPLTAALKCKDANVREAAAEALGRLAWRPTRTAAGAAYWVAEGRWDECAKIGAPAVPSLIAALDDESMRAGATGALVQIGAPAVEPLIAVLKEDRVIWDAQMTLREAVAKALIQIGDPRAADDLFDHALLVLARTDWKRRKAAAERLVALYQSGRLNEAQKGKLLARRGVITSSHEDDYEGCGGHTDKGNGVEFPI
jgi:HEAT repeat protein